MHHNFPSGGALGGERSTRDDVTAWLDRLYRVLPGLKFHVQAIAVDGWPWNTTVGVEWTNTATLLDGSPYTNTGAHILRIRWGKIVFFTPTSTTSPPSTTPCRPTASLGRHPSRGVRRASARPTRPRPGAAQGWPDGGTRPARASGATGGGLRWQRSFPTSSTPPRRPISTSSRPQTAAGHDPQLHLRAAALVPVPARAVCALRARGTRRRARVRGEPRETRIRNGCAAVRRAATGSVKPRTGKPSPGHHCSARTINHQLSLLFGFYEHTCATEFGPTGQPGPCAAGVLGLTS